MAALLDEPGGSSAQEMRAAGYARTEILGAEVTVLNSASAIYRWTLLRQRNDGGEINRLTATYLVTDGAAGRRISVLAVHSPLIPCPGHAGHAGLLGIPGDTVESPAIWR